jgi:UDP-N-acetylmuramoylalanine--D-glutamate ligase
MPERQLCILGAARSGLAAARLAVQKGWQVSVCDRNESADVLRAVKEAGASFLPEGYLPASCDTLLLSPVIHQDHPMVLEARGRAIPVLSEVDFARSCFNGLVIGITGSNGKTTTTLLAEAAFKATGQSCVACGNIGIPFSAVAMMEPQPEVALLELSSYQLEQSQQLRLDGACLLNLSEDHLERHGSMQGYLMAKLRIIDQLKPGAPLVANADDNWLRPALQSSELPWLSFGRAPDCDAAVCDTSFVLATHPGKTWISVADCQLKGRHNLENMAAVSLLMIALGYEPDVIRQALSDMPAPEHRIEELDAIKGVRFINDSKGTNVDATARALEGMPEGRVLLLAGGVSKTKDYSMILSLLESRVKQLLCYGRDGATIAAALVDVVPARSFQNMDEAFQAALSLAGEQDIVLLSPMCASFDQFADFEARGRHFKQLVREAQSGGQAT